MSEAKMRECGGCTKCCEGWLQADIKGHKMYPGRPCHFLAAGACTIYGDRPGTCRNYNCAWKSEDIFPAWMRPDLSGVIITKMVNPMNPQAFYYEVSEAGGKLSVSALNWLVQWVLETGNNLSYEIEGKRHLIGNSVFKSSIPLG